jgi:hypothetical protein
MAPQKNIPAENIKAIISGAKGAYFQLTLDIPTLENDTRRTKNNSGSC